MQYTKIIRIQLFISLYAPNDILGQLYPRRFTMKQTITLDTQSQGVTYAKGFEAIGIQAGLKKAANMT